MLCNEIWESSWFLPGHTTDVKRFNHEESVSGEVETDKQSEAVMKALISNTSLLSGSVDGLPRTSCTKWLGLIVWYNRRVLQ